MSARITPRERVTAALNFEEADVGLFLGEEAARGLSLRALHLIVRAGTMTSGLALLRVVDSNFETPVAEDLVYGNGLILFVGLQVMLMASVPALGYARGETLKYLLITIALTAAYMLLLLVGWKIYNKSHRKPKASAVG